MNIYVKLLICLFFTTKLSNCLPSKDAQRISHKTNNLEKRQSVADNEVIAEVDTGPVKFRCGYDDVVKEKGHRHKRFTLLASKWQNWNSGVRNTLLWTYDNSHPQYRGKVNEIREAIAEATRIWSDSSVLKFSEVQNTTKADIVISFQSEYHPNIDPYAINDTTLAHAFPPASGIGGDIHIRDNQIWHFDLKTPTPSRSNNFFAVVLHEMGHALGLDHSDVPEAVMYESLHEKTGTLHEDDIKGIEHIYGKTNKSKPMPDDDLPDRCTTDFDAATLIRGELFLFKNKYLWRPRKNQDAFRIRDIFAELPSDMTHIDAVFEAADRKIWFFIGREIYIFEGPKFLVRRSLQSIGINQQKYRKIDAIFRWPFSNRTYIFSGDDYWRLDKDFNVEKDYPKEILGTWKDVYDIDTAFTDVDQLYFFKGPNAYKFDSARMRINRMNSTKIGVTFMGCIDIASRNPNDDRETHDVIHEYPPDEEKEDLDNIEKREPNNSNSVKTDIVYKYVIIVVSFTSLCFSNMF